MDAEKFGAFIAEMRKQKQMTQKELAEKLHVTDKAVSRWERGLGFPDINTIEALADALGISIMELMASQQKEEGAIPKKEAADALADTIFLAGQQRKHMIKEVCLACALGMLGVLALVLVVYYHVRLHMAISFVSSADGPTTVFVAGKIGSLVPTGMAVAGVLLIVAAITIIRRNRH